MAATGLPPLLEEPVWYGPLLRPSWLLPSVRDGAPRILLRPGDGDHDDDLRLGLPLFLGEAVRYSTDARVDVDTDGRASTPGSAAVVTAGLEGQDLRVAVADGSGGTVGELRLPAGDAPSLGAALAALPSRLVASLQPRGARAMWSTVFQAPPAGLAIAYTRSHGALARLRWLLAQPQGDDDGRERAGLARAALTHLAHAASAHASPPLGVAAFLAGLVVAREAGVPVWGDFRLQTNAIAQGATDPMDPVFRLSIVSLVLFGDTGEATARGQRLGRDVGDDLRAWLARVRTIG